MGAAKSFDLLMGIVEEIQVKYVNGPSIAAPLGILGISPFNSFFNPSLLHLLMKWAYKYYGQFVIFIPDTATVYSLMALGYSQDKAENKSRRQCRYLHNKCVTALAREDLTIEQSPIISEAWLSRSEVYKQKLEYVKSRYLLDPIFADICDGYSRDFLVPKNISPDSASLQMASKYLLHELPIMLYGAEIFEVSRADFVYPDKPEFFKKIVEGQTSLEINKQKIEFIAYSVGVLK